MFLVHLVRQTEGELHPLVDVEPHLAVEAELVVDGLNVPGQVRPLHRQAVGVLLLVLGEAAHLVLDTRDSVVYDKDKALSLHEPP